MNPLLKKVGYVSAWFFAWLLFGFIINTGLIQASVYSPEALGPQITFGISGLISLAGGLSLYGEVLGKSSN